MMKYINKYRLLYEHQYGFRAGYNTTQPIQHLLDKIFNTLNNDKNYYTLAIFIDLTKSFDTCEAVTLTYFSVSLITMVFTVWPITGSKVIYLNVSSSHLSGVYTPPSGSSHVEYHKAPYYITFHTTH